MAMLTEREKKARITAAASAAASPAVMMGVKPLTVPPISEGYDEPAAPPAAPAEPPAAVPAAPAAADLVDVWVMTDTGLRRWRPMVDQVDVLRLPGGQRRIEFRGYGGITLKLGPDEAKHIGLKLSDDLVDTSKGA